MDARLGRLAARLRRNRSESFDERCRRTREQSVPRRSSSPLRRACPARIAGGRRYNDKRRRSDGKETIAELNIAFGFCWIDKEIDPPFEVGQLKIHGGFSSGAT